MHIETAKPFARGVKELMYVGDVPLATPIAITPTTVIAGIVALETTGLTRLIAAGVALWSMFGQQGS